MTFDLRNYTRWAHFHSKPNISHQSWYQPWVFFHTMNRNQFGTSFSAIFSGKCEIIPGKTRTVVNGVSSNKITFFIVRVQCPLRLPVPTFRTVMIIDRFLSRMKHFTGVNFTSKGLCQRAVVGEPIVWCCRGCCVGARIGSFAAFWLISSPLVIASRVWIIAICIGFWIAIR